MTQDINEDTTVETIPVKTADATEKAEAAEVSAPSDDDTKIASYLDDIKQTETSGSPFADLDEDESKKKHTGLKVVISLVLAILLVADSFVGWFYFNDKAHASIVPNGVTLAGRDSLGSMDENAVNSAITSKADELLKTPVVVSLDASRTQETELGAFVSINTGKMVAEAIGIRSNATLEERLRLDVLKTSIDHDIGIDYTVDEKAVTKYVTKLAETYNQKKISSAIIQKNGKIVIPESKNGLEVDTDVTKASIVAAITSAFEQGTFPASLSATIAGGSTSPKTTAASLSDTPAIVVTLSKRQVALYNGEKLIKTYNCAIGQPGHKTPVGNWEIVLKRTNPIWRNPGSEWAKDMPATIGPSANSPLGLRALNLNVSGIRIHGTVDINSIGTAASHGCMRIRNADIIDLFDRVNIGTKVFIIP
ncbi:MAG: L,D-transpeptidase/peptidoglycan binding protein [Coriobacteriia bacterium]|nr:L,D-transpeptidase/peptidoglycan binding protein [Coriobacteriia bacterium]